MFKLLFILLSIFSLSACSIKHNFHGIKACKESFCKHSCINMQYYTGMLSIDSRRGLMPNEITQCTCFSVENRGKPFQREFVFKNTTCK